MKMKMLAVTLFVAGFSAGTAGLWLIHPGLLLVVLGGFCCALGLTGIKAEFNDN